MTDIENMLRRLATPPLEALSDSDRLTELAKVGLQAADELERLRTENERLNRSLYEVGCRLREAISAMS